MTEKPHQEKGTLVLALIAGLSVNGAFAALFSSIVPFSIFPLIALVLSVYCLHQRYLHHSMPEGIPMLAAACFLLGLLIYSAIVRVEYPAIGSNFIPSILCVVLVFWIGLKLRRRKATESVSAEESETL
ncbi:YijD family membrane protein [Pectobacterium aroidearum]|uniref:YijD family membrane protein n=1 Tax=Pectobacterium aroidearum TaxID=1201031 RepID=UPI003158A294